ncbi:MAG: PD40 domain-containing protein [Lachnospiraceae bacterium]|nr:PD40 domain-containing protein [Lachnospiraceae bacterium]
MNYPSEKFDFIDTATGVQVTRLTGWRANSNHLYFTNNCFYDRGKRIVFESDRGNAHNLFSMDLECGEMEQLTDFPVLPYPRAYGFLESFVDPVHGNCCFFAEESLYVLNLRSKELNVIYRMPKGFFHHISSITADGKYVLTSIYETSGDDFAGNRALQDICDAKPLSKILRIPVNGGSAEVVWEEKNFIAHVNASPTDPDLLTFCHEGHWNMVDHRLWLARISTGQVCKLHPCGEREMIGHEYWYADGKRVGYHGEKEGQKLLGAVDLQTGADISYSFPFNTGHIFSLNEKLIVGDGDRDGRYIRLWRLTENGYEEPRALCLHGSSCKRQRSHVHPRLTPDGKAVLYTSDETGYEQLYLAQLPEDLTALPMLSTLSDK